MSRLKLNIIAILTDITFFGAEERDGERYDGQGIVV